MNPRHYQYHQQVSFKELKKFEFEQIIASQSNQGRIKRIVAIIKNDNVVYEVRYRNTSGYNKPYEHRTTSVKGMPGSDKIEPTGISLEYAVKFYNSIKI